ncbi:dynein heavy chain, putative, partial [Plasmodium malariae]
MERRNDDSQVYGVYKWVLNKLKFSYKEEYNIDYLIDDNAEEKKDVVVNFVRKEKDDVLLFNIENNKMVIAKEENIKFDQKIVYFYKYLNKDMRDDKNILYGILSPNILDTLKLMLKKIIFPLFLNNKIIYNSVSKDEVNKFAMEFDTYIKELSEFILILEDIKKVKLKMKKDQSEIICENGNDKSELKEDKDTTSINRQYNKTGNETENKIQKKKKETDHLTKYLNILENLFNDMQQKILEYKKSNIDVGPFIEIQYWRYKHRYLLFIMEELRSNEIKNIINNINISNTSNEEQKYTYTFDILNKWRELETKIENEFNESKDNIKYLESIEQFILSLYLCNVENIIDNIPPLLNSIKMIYLVARFYNTPNKLKNLFIKITNQLVVKCKEEIFCAKRKKRKKRRKRRKNKRNVKIKDNEYGDNKSETNVGNNCGGNNQNENGENYLNNAGKSNQMSDFIKNLDNYNNDDNDDNVYNDDRDDEDDNDDYDENDDINNNKDGGDYDETYKKEKNEMGYGENRIEYDENCVDHGIYYDSDESEEDQGNEDGENNTIHRTANEREEGEYNMKDENTKTEALKNKQNLWLLDPDDLIKKFELCFKLHEKYREEFENIKTFFEENSKNRSVDLDTKVIFCKIEIFCRRLKKLVDLFLCIKQFKNLRKMKFDCIQNITSAFNKYIKEFKLKHTDDMLNYTYNYFDRDFVELRVYISELESDLQENIVNLLSNSSNIMLSFFIFFKFKEYFIRDYLITFLHTKYDILLLQFLEILNNINNDLENYKSNLNSSKNINYLKNIFWILSINYKVNHIMKIFLDENNLSIKDEKNTSSYFELSHLNNNLPITKLKTDFEKIIEEEHTTTTMHAGGANDSRNNCTDNIDIFYAIYEQVLKLLEDHDKKKTANEDVKIQVSTFEEKNKENVPKEGEVALVAVGEKDNKIKNVLFKSSNGKEVLKLYVKIYKFIDEYKNRLFKHWLSFTKNMNSLNVTVFVKHPKTKNVIVNFDNRIKRIIREAKIFLSFNFEIPEEIKNMISQETKIYSLYYKFYNILIL